MRRRLFQKNDPEQLFRVEWFAGGTWSGVPTVEERTAADIPSSLIIIGAFAMFSEIEPFTLGFFAGTQAHCLVDDEKEDGRTDA